MEELLEDFAPSIESKISAIRTGVNNLIELEVINREAKNLLSKYEIETEKCSQFCQLYPDLPIAQHRATYNRLIGELHSAMLQARAKLSKNRSVDSGDFFRRRNMIISSDPAASLAQEISTSLKTLNSILQDEVLRGENSLEILQRSAKRMETTGELYHGFGGVLATSKRLIKGLWIRERTDRWMIMAVLGLFYLVFTYVVMERLWLGKLIVPFINRLVRWIWNVFIWTLTYALGIFWKSNHPKVMNGSIESISDCLTNYSENLASKVNAPFTFDSSSPDIDHYITELADSEVNSMIISVHQRERTYTRNNNSDDHVKPDL